MKNKIRLTEEDLKNIINEAVYRIINESQIEEGFWDSAKGMANKVGGDIKHGMSNMVDKAKQGVTNMADKAKQGVNNMYTMADKAKQGITNMADKAKQGVSNAVTNTKNYYNDVKQAGVDASNNADIEKSIKMIQDLAQKQLVNQKAANMVISSMRKYIK